jgi:hypothetical protein
MSTDEPDIHDSFELSLVSVDDGTVIPEIPVADGEPQFPEFVDDWTDVLDCRSKPYTDRDIETNCELARGVRKAYILVGKKYLSEQLDDID